MRKIFASDNSLKVISVLIAITIWIYIAIVMDPAIEVSVRDLPIQFIGQDVLENNGLAVISESATTVSVKVKGSRKKMGVNDMKTIIAKADVSSAKIGSNSIPIEIVVPFENQGLSSQSLYSIDVNVETISRKSIDIDIRSSGTLAQGYMCGDIKAEPEKIFISGPKSAIEKVSKAVVRLDFSGADVDIDTELPLGFLDDTGNEISSVDTILKRLDVSPERVMVHCPVVKIKEIVPTVRFNSSDLPENFKYKMVPSILYTYSSDGSPVKIDKIETEAVDLDRLLLNDKIKVKLIIPENIKVLNHVSELEISVESK